MPHMTECTIRVRRAVIAKQGNDVPQANDAVLVKVFGTIVRLWRNRKVAVSVVEDG